MQKRFAILLVIAGSLLAAASAASAQSLAFSATDHVKADGRNGTPSCPGDEAACGTGTSPQFGAFTYTLTFLPTTNLAELTFSNGSVLALDETFQFNTTPGNSGDSSATKSFGSPNYIFSTWSLDTTLSSPTFTSYGTGSGTDVLHFAGIAGQGAINGSLG